MFSAIAGKFTNPPADRVAPVRLKALEPKAPVALSEARPIRTTGTPLGSQLPSPSAPVTTPSLPSAANHSLLKPPLDFRGDARAHAVDPGR